MDSVLMISGFLLLSLLLGCTGAYMLLTPRRFAAVCEAFAAAGNLPSLLPRSVKAALLQVRAFGVCCLACGLVLVVATVDLMKAVLTLRGSGIETKLYWLIVPAALGISAGYVILLYGSDWVARTFGKWVDHPLVPQELVLALTWELRIAGVAFTMFGLGAASLWLKSLLGG